MTILSSTDARTSPGVEESLQFLSKEERKSKKSRLDELNQLIATLAPEGLDYTKKQLEIYQNKYDLAYDKFRRTHQKEIENTATIEQLNKEVTQTQFALSQQASIAASKSAWNRRCEEMSEEKSKEIKELKTSLKTLKGQHEETDKKLSETTENLTTQTTSLKELEEKCDKESAKCRKQTTSLKVLKKKYDKESVEFQKQKKSYLKVKEQISKLKREKKRLISELAEQTESLKVAISQSKPLAVLQAKVNGLEGQIAVCSEI